MNKKAIFIVRGFNKTAEDFQDFEHRFNVVIQQLHTHLIPYQILYSTPDTDPIITNHFPIEVIHIDGSIEKPLWSTGLNTPIQHILNTIQPEDAPYTSIIPYSFETTLTNKQAELLATTILSGERFIGHRITPQWLNDYPVHPLQHLQDMSDHIQNNSLSALANNAEQLQRMCMYGRNTLGHYYATDFIAHGLFNPETDALGGMEDWEFLLRVAKQDVSYLHSISTVVEYTDTRIKESETDTQVMQQQREKLQREISALTSIILSLE